MMRPSSARWVFVTNYPQWPSPYFTQLEQALISKSFPHTFSPFLPLPEQLSAGDVVNLHRLKRLYVDEDCGRRTRPAAERLVAHVRRLQARGVRVVWTLHNPYPIDGGAVDDVDIWLTHEMLQVVDHAIVHTSADGDGAVELGATIPITVAGWAGMPTREVSAGLSQDLAGIAAEMASEPLPILMLGNWTEYKNIPDVVRAIVERTRRLKLFVVGPCRDERIRSDVFAAAAEGGERVRVDESWVAPADLYWLFAAARASVCNYDTRTNFAFFRKILHPSSVSSSVVFGLPIVAPGLKGVSEISAGHDRALYDPDGDIGDALAEAELALESGLWADARPTFDQVVEDDKVRWANIVENYKVVWEYL
jgi:beta-1,4-mannosyltransferase